MTQTDVTLYVQNFLKSVQVADKPRSIPGLIKIAIF